MAVSRFSGWYWPRLHARALVLSRAQEYHADGIAAGSAGAPAALAALWKMECWQPMLAEHFCQEVYRGAEQSDDPPSDIVERMRRAYRTAPAPEDAARWQERALSRTTGGDETHPSFQDRARALGASAEEFRRLGFPTAPEPSATEVLLGEERAAITSELADHWRRVAMAGWRARHRRAAAEARRRGASGGSESEDAVPPPIEDIAAIWGAARASVEVKGPGASVPLLRAVLERDPAHPVAGVVLGGHLLEKGDPEGRRLLEQVVVQDDEFWVRQACQLLHGHFRVTGQEEDLRRMRGRLDRLDEESAAAARERATVRPGDAFFPHGLDEEELGRLRAVLAAQDDCGRAWLVRKALRYQPHQPLFVLYVRRKSSRWWALGDDRDRALVRRLTPVVPLPGQVLIVAAYGSFRKTARRVRSSPGAEVFCGFVGGSIPDSRFQIPDAKF